MKAKYMLLAILLLGAVLLQSLVVETASLKGFIYGQEPACEYDNWVTHLAEKIVSAGYNVYAPWDSQTNGFGDFHVPNTDEMTNWGIVIDEFLLQNWTNVDNLLLAYGFPYQCVQFNDTDTGRTYYMLRENLIDALDDNGTPDTYDDEMGAFAWGWGLYVYNPNGDNRTVVTVPHPCDDFFASIMGYVALTTLNAEYLLINGAGREVAWTNVAPYANSKSLSDPTRTTNHPWHPAYTRFCTQIRSDSGKREFSLQLHSYDTALHTNFSSVQISAGYNKTCPNLPIRDLSRFKHDLINEADYLMLPANTIGSHTDVHVNDYYTVQYSTHPFTYDNGEVNFNINNYMDLGAYSGNVQMNYTLSGWNDYDVYEPFFHAEMDELPNCYTQNDNTYKWFWSWNTQTQRWNIDRLYDNAIQYYSIWLDDLSEVLTETLIMDNFIDPFPPTNLVAFNQAYDYITLQWQKADEFDFDTYEILYSTQPIGTTGFNIYSRTNDAYLASPYCEQINVTGLSNSVQYYFKIRAKDKSGNYSVVSNEVTAVTSPARITTFRGIGMDDLVSVRWNVTNQQNNQGFKIYRKVNDGDFSLRDSYETNPVLVGGNVTYQWDDVFVVNGNSYTYKVSSVNAENVEFFHNVTSTCSPRDYFTLYVATQDNSLVDSLTFSANPNASSGNDSDYDLYKGNPAPTTFVYGAFWEQYWGSNGTYLQQEVKGDFNPDTGLQTWAIRVKSDQLGVPLTFRVDDSYGRYTEKLYLRDNSTAYMHDLETGPYTFQVTDTNYKSFTLYWGNLQPTVSVSYLPNRIYQGGAAQIFNWSANFSFLLSHYNLSIQTDTDSLFVSENLPNSTTSYNFIFPTNINLQKARFVVDGWASDGQRIRQSSSYLLGVVPLNTIYNPEPGLQMQANVWPNSSPMVNQVFGANALAWTMDSNSAWWQISPFSFGLGYWIQKMSPFEYTATNPIQRDSISFVIRTGWNIIPNPHICTYKAGDLRFRINGVYYSFAEMMDQELISRGVYVYRNGCYTLTDTIYPFESFLLKFYGTAMLITSINFAPYNNGTDIQPIEPIWELKLTAQQNDSDTDEMFVGSNLRSIDNYDFTYDLPEPPAKPVDNLTRLYLYKTAADITFIDLQLNSEFCSPFNNSIQDEQVFNFRLEVGNTNPVNFHIDSSAFPDEYGAAIHIGNIQYDIQHGDNFVYLPAQTGVHSGQIIVHNYFTANQDESISALTGLRVYPNPFNPQTTITFDLFKNSDVAVDIYNVKGQHVKSLCNGQLKSGRQHLVWDGKDKNNRSTGTGLYFARVKTSDATRTIKLMLMK